MTNDNEDIKIHRAYSALTLSEQEQDAIYECWYSGVNHDGHVWVTWTDVQKMILGMKG